MPFGSRTRKGTASGNQVLVMTTRYGEAYQNGSGVRAPRLIKLDVQVDF